jgi:hypothetical protein
MTQDLGALARAIIDANSYMTLGTADPSGLPWVAPVWFAAAGYREFFWVSAPESTHSRNIAERAQVAIVIFDSTVPIYSGQAVYMSALAHELPGADIPRAIDIFSRRSEAQGASRWTADDVRPPARHRLYRATASEHFVLNPQDERVPVRVTG